MLSSCEENIFFFIIVSKIQKEDFWNYMLYDFCNEFRLSISQEAEIACYESPPVSTLKAYEDDCKGFYLSRLCPVSFVLP